jgi:hypothetical protein
MDALSDMRRIILVLMHIFIQSQSSYKSTFSYQISDDAETQLQQSPLSLPTVEHEIKQLLIPIEAVLKPSVSRESALS